MIKRLQAYIDRLILSCFERHIRQSIDKLNVYRMVADTVTTIDWSDHLDYNQLAHHLDIDYIDLARHLDIDTAEIADELTGKIKLSFSMR